MITGMPASTAAFTDVFERVGIGERDGDAVDAVGDGLLDELGLVRRRRCWRPGTCTVIPRSSPACSAPFWATDQNTPSSPWVMTAIVMSPPSVASTVSTVDEPVPPSEAGVVSDEPLVPPVAGEESATSLSLSLLHAVASSPKTANDASRYCVSSSCFCVPPVLEW